MGTSGAIDQLQSTARYYAAGIYRQIADKQVFLWAQAIAFKVLITIVPIIILLVAIFARVLDRPDAFADIQQFIEGFLPQYRSDDLIRRLQALAEIGGTLTVIAVGGLLFSAVTLFTTLRIVVSSVFQEEWHQTRTIVGGYLFDIRMAAQVGVVFVLTFTISLALQALRAYEFVLPQWLGLDGTWINEGWQQVMTYTGLLLPFLLSVAMFWQLFFFVPVPKPPKRSALIGATVAALLWEVAKGGFAFYASNLGRFERYRAEPPSETSGVEEAAEALVDSTRAVLGDVFGLIIAFVFWVYFSGIILCLGAIVALLHESRFRTVRGWSRQPRSKRRRRQADAEGEADAAAEADAPGEGEPDGAAVGDEPERTEA